MLNKKEIDLIGSILLENRFEYNEIFEEYVCKLANSKKNTLRVSFIEMLDDYGGNPTGEYFIAMCHYITPVHYVKKYPYIHDLKEFCEMLSTIQNIIDDYHNHVRKWGDD